MKKILALLLSAVLAASLLTACKNDGSDKADGTTDVPVNDTIDIVDTTKAADTTDITGTTDTIDTTDIADTADTVDTADTTDTVDTPDVTEPPMTDAPVITPPVTDAPVTQPPAPEYVAGKLTSKDYNSTWLNLYFKPNSNMTFATAKELSEITMGDTICEMMATDKTTLGTAVITVFPTTYTTMVDYFVGLLETYAGTGVEIEIGEISDKKLGGTAYSFAFCDMTYMGETMKTATYFRVIGDRSVTVIITYQTEAELNNFISCFSAAK